MITTKLLGGLGNQMFQISTVYAYAKAHGFDYGFDFDSCYTPNQGHTSTKYKDTLFKHFNRLDNTKFNMTYKEPFFSYNEIAKNDNIILDGYFQSEKYFKEYKSELNEMFIFPEDTVGRVSSFLDKNNFTNLTSVHVRRGDYIKPPEKQEFHFNLGKTDYYEDAMEILGGGDFIFASDDIDWCKKMYFGDDVHFSPFTNELDDLYLMTICDNNIIANSSLSWWGAWLNNSRNHKVIAPNNWFGPKGPQDTQDLIPENWIKI